MKLLKHSKLVLGLAFFCIGITFAQNSLPKETVYKGIYDYAGMLSPQEQATLTQKLTQYADSTSTQIAVVTVKSLQGQEIAMLATETAHAWGLGNKDKDNGVLILVAKHERKIHIATGYGVEEKLTDYVCKQMIETIVKPNFKNKQYFNGLDQATTQMIQILNGTFKPAPKKEGGLHKGSLIILIALVVLVIVLMNRSKPGNNKPHQKGGMDSDDIFTAMMLGSMGSSLFRNQGGGGGFGSGSGFGGFGGGGFGGGGASGDW